MSSFSINKNNSLSNLNARYVLTPDNPLYIQLVKNKRMIVKKDFKSSFITTASLNLANLNEGSILSRSSYGNKRWNRFGISTDKYKHDIIMPKTLQALVNKILPSDSEGVKNFGQSVAISGDVAIASAHGDIAFKGSAYIFTRNNGVWSETVKLTASDGVNNDLFGWSVAISGDVAIIGAYGDDSTKGSAYIFTRNNGVWSETVKLTASDGEGGDLFGYSVAISGDVAIVGASGDDSLRGSAYIFTRNNGVWSETVKLTASDGANDDRFGYSVAISGDITIVGAYGDNSITGSAYIFTRNNGVWSETVKLTASDGAIGDRFGYSVAISGDVAIIGADGDDSFRGSAYIFTRNNGVWSETAKLTASDGAILDNFGYSVAISGDVAIVGAYLDNSNTGSAYMFTRNNGVWSETVKLTASDGEGGDLFGRSVAVSGQVAIVGVPSTTAIRESAYIFKGLIYKGDIQVRQ